MLVKPAGQRLIKEGQKWWRNQFECWNWLSWSLFVPGPHLWVDVEPFERESAFVPGHGNWTKVRWQINTFKCRHCDNRMRSWAYLTQSTFWYKDPDIYETWPDEWWEDPSWTNTNRQKYDNERKWLEQSGWYQGCLSIPSPVEVEQDFNHKKWVFAKGFVSGRNFISTRYSWVTLQIMADFASDNRWSIKFNRAGIYGVYSLAKEPFLLARLRDLQSYIAQKCGPIPTSSGVGQSKWQDWFSHPAPCDKASQYPWLAELRRVYCHFSARIQDGWNYIPGVHAPQYNGESRQRRIFKG